MAMTQEQHEALERNKGMFDVDMQKYYYDELKPYLENMLANCRTDEELVRTIEKVLNSANTFVARKQYAELRETFVVLNTAITDPSYFSGAGAAKKASEDEKKIIKGLPEKIQNLWLIIEYEEKLEKSPEEEKTADRVDYDEINKRNNDSLTHNMKTLNETKPKTRIPNIK